MVWQIHDRGKFEGFGYGVGGWGVMEDLLWVLLLLGLLVLVGVLIARLLRSPHSSKTSPIQTPDRALEVARERYAKGEISLAEFETLKKNLSG
ncbi:SHOCT domain-containing protein [uncultured Meiothermus sp.]|jgi:putative membrane protein|uniref:SHOCT domain-containing protein n=1 Tax=uncultured Meiothermus sp. TaxID=157471 RepID=UPI00260B8FAC|nr:SHOCT domain-containing protein [uncultured Meiothermus sp.]